MKQQTSSLPSIFLAATIHRVLNNLFRLVTDTSAPNFDGVYVTSTLLNPAYRGLLNENHIAKAKDLVDVDE